MVREGKRRGHDRTAPLPLTCVTLPISGTRFSLGSRAMSRSRLKYNFRVRVTAWMRCVAITFNMYPVSYVTVSKV